MKKQMKTLIVVIGLLVISISFCGCIGDDDDIKTVMISGVGKTVTIDESVPIELRVSCMDNTITVKKGTDVKEIMLSGVNNIIYLPSECNPEIMESGVDNQIIIV